MLEVRECKWRANNTTAKTCYTCCNSISDTAQSQTFPSANISQRHMLRSGEVKAKEARIDSNIALAKVPPKRQNSLRETLRRIPFPSHFWGIRPDLERDGDTYSPPHQPKVAQWVWSGTCWIQLKVERRASRLGWSKGAAVSIFHLSRTKV